LGVRRVLPLRLKSARGLVLIAVCLAASSALEYVLLYYGFLAPGLEDTYIWKLGLWTQVIPAFSVVALTISWLHLTRSFFYEPKRPVKRAKARRKRKKRGKGRGLRLQLPSLKPISGPLSSFRARLEGLLGRLGMAVLRGLGVLVLGACIAFMTAAILAYWPALGHISAKAVESYPFMAWLMSSLDGLSKAVNSVEQLKWAVGKLMEASMDMAKALRPAAKAILEADPLYKYAVLQNLVIWSSGLAALAYRRPPIRRR